MTYDSLCYWAVLFAVVVEIIKNLGTRYWTRAEDERKGESGGAEMVPPYNLEKDGD